jgi:hypothetical protein
VPHPKKIVLHCPNGYTPRLDALVEEFVRDFVIFVGVVGQDCAKVEDIIDELVVGDGSRDYHILTSSHPGESVDEAVRFAEALTGEFEGKAHVVVVADLLASGALSDGGEGNLGQT